MTPKIKTSLKWRPPQKCRWPQKGGKASTYSSFPAPSIRYLKGRKKSQLALLIIPTSDIWGSLIAILLLEVLITGKKDVPCQYLKIFLVIQHFTTWLTFPTPVHTNHPSTAFLKTGIILHWASQHNIWWWYFFWARVVEIFIIHLVLSSSKGLMHYDTSVDETFASHLTPWGHYREGSRKKSMPWYTSDLSWHRVSAIWVLYFWSYEHFSERHFRFLALRFWG